MESKYYDKWEFEQLLSLAIVNPIEADIQYEEYLSKHSEDYTAYAYYASNLITLGKLDKAQKVLEYVESLYRNDANFAELDKTKSFEHNLVYSKLKLLAYQKKYDKLFSFYKKNSYKLNEHKNMDPVIFYCLKQMEMLDVSKRHRNSYIFRQILEYNEDDFFEHIQKHLSEYNMNQSCDDKSLFGADFPIKDVVSEVKKRLQSSKSLYIGFYDDTYVFKYDGCGRVDNKLVDYFKVVCFHGTSDIITMFPDKDCQTLPHVDINYMQLSSPSKKESQIEKFRNRYKR